MISIDDFKKVEIKVGQIISAERVPEADRLLKLSVDFGQDGHRQIMSGIAAYYPDPTVLVGKKCPFVINLEHRMLRGYESQGMILAVENSDGFFSLLEASSDTPPGNTVK